MKRFIITITIGIAIPLVILLAIYLWTDPFRCLHAFDINDVDVTNREYLSTELFLRNNPVYHYNSFIFSSSRGGGMNTYQWKSYLPDDAQPFLFQAWSESLTCIELKMNYLNEHDIPINNALIMFDIPGTFSSNQLPKEALSMKHYMFTGHTKFIYNAYQFFNFIQKPSLWRKSIKYRLHHVKEACCSDTITNDWDNTCALNYKELPAQDSLKHCTEMTRTTFFSTIEHSGYKVSVSKPVITQQFEKQLRHIRAILNENETDYHIILSPGYCYTNPEVNPQDLKLLQEIFGSSRVHNYTGKNELTEDYNNYSDPGHFGLRVGFLIIEDIYKKE